jgi:hypothetical protein
MGNCLGFIRRFRRGRTPSAPVETELGQTAATQTGGADELAPVESSSTTSFRSRSEEPRDEENEDGIENRGALAAAPAGTFSCQN